MNSKACKFLILISMSIFMWLLGLPTQAAVTNKTGDEGNIYVNAYIYAYPLVLMSITKGVMTNASAGSTYSSAPVNQFSHFRSFPDPNFKDVVRPNVDTLYSSAWLDLSQQPLVLTASDSNNRYYLLQMLDGWTEVFASPGKRTTGTAAKNFVIIGPYWNGGLPAGLTVLKSPTNMVWIIGRIQTNGQQDYEKVHKIQNGFKLVPLSKWGKKYQPAKEKINSNIDTKTPPPQQVDNLDSIQYLQLFAELLTTNPPHPSDSEMINRLKTIGIVPGKSFDPTKLTAQQVTKIDNAFAQAKGMIKSAAINLGKQVNGWNIIRENIGIYGNNYLNRAAVALFGLGANEPRDAIYPLVSTDANSEALNGKHSYVIHFNKGQLPPVNAFWSITLYDGEGYLVPNTINRFAIGDRDNLKYNPDGSLDIYIQNKSPGVEKESNWLPAPKKDFNLTMRLYWPQEDIITGKWNPPAIKKVSRFP